MYRGPLSKHATALAGLAALLLVSGCMPVPVSGFKPIYPKVTSGLFSEGQLDWTRVYSLQPTFRWEPMPGQHERGRGALSGSKPFIAAAPERIRNVRYDLKIWRVVGEFPEEVVYEREGIEGTSHQIQQPLQPGTKYYWSVRARFELDGKTRVSEWSLSMFPQSGSRTSARRTGQIPPSSYYRFKTPRSDWRPHSRIKKTRFATAGAAHKGPERRAEQGDADAQFQLGAYYLRTNRLDDAWKLFCLAANQGHARAQLALARKFHRGSAPVAQDYVQSYVWYSLAASNGIRYAAKERDNLAETMTPAQIAEAERLVKDWKPGVGSCEPKSAGVSR